MTSRDVRRSGKLAADKDRDVSLDMLARAVSEGRLTVEEYESRMTGALTARTFNDISAVVADLPEEMPAPALPVAEAKLVAIFGNETRKGEWSVPEYLLAKSIFGDCHIEMGQARLQGKVTRIDAIARFGSITIIVPDGIDVRLTGHAIFGSKATKLRRRVRPGSPILDVRCDILFGSVTVMAHCL